MTTSSTLQVSLASTLSTSSFAPLNPSSAGTGLGLEQSFYSLSHDITDGKREPVTQQKITLLSRPHNPTSSQSQLSTSPLTDCIDDAMMEHMGTSGLHLLNDDGSGQLLPLTRGDGYFDSEDPSVNLHDFIVNSLQAQKNRVILLQLEEEFLKYITDQNRADSLRLPSWDSYHRMLAHRVAAYFGLDHNVDPLDKTCVIVQKGPSTRIPVQRFNEHIPNLEENDVGSTTSEQPKLILKRIRGTSGSETFDGLDGLSSSSATEIKSFEEREVEYEKARARIFSQSINKLQDLSESTDKSFDLFNSNNTLRSALRAPMSHRRTFSDTTFFNTLKKSKQGPSSSGNSPSNTPSLFFPSLSPPSSLTPPPFLSKSTSPPTIGVGAIDVVNTSPHRKSNIQEDSPSMVQSIVQSIQQPEQQQQNIKTVQSRPQSTSYVPFYSQTPPPTIPVMYHPQPTIVNPLYYNPMVVYPITPHPTAAIHTYSQMVNSPVLQSYPTNTVITHPLSYGSQKMGGMRMATPSIIPEPLSPTGVVYRPLQPAPVQQVKPYDYTVTGTPGGPIWSTQVDPMQYTVGYPPNHQGLPSPQGYPPVMGVSQLAEQMEKGMTISEEMVNSDHSYINDKSRMSPIVQRMTGPPGNGRGLPGPVYGFSMQPGMDQVIVSPTTGAPPLGSFFPGPEAEQHMGYHPQMGERQDNHQTLSHLLQHSHPGLLQPQAHHHHHQAMFQHAGNITPQPAQILGHSLSTTIFSPPPSAGPGPPTVFYSSSTGKPSITHGGSPAHAPVGSGLKFKKYASPQQLSRPDMPMTPQSPVSSHQSPVLLEQQQHTHGSGGSPGVPINNDIGIDMLGGSPHLLPPRLNQRAGGSGTRYQNQRHPSNRNAIKGDVYTGTGQVQGNAYPTQIRREPLLPTPSEMIKLDTGITAGVPVNVMEVLYPPHEDSPEYQVLIQHLQECGAQDFKRGILGRNMEVMVAIFDSPDAALQGLKQCVLPVPAKLTIPLPNHARYILQLLST